MTDLSGAVVLVVGASGGLGSRITALLSAAGATVITASRASGWDLREAAMPTSLVGVIERDHGRLDGLVIAAGVVAFGAADEVSDETVDELFAVNAMGPIRLIRAASALLKASSTEGRSPFIVTLSGVVAESPTAGMAAYSASKAALAAFVSAASRELRRGGVRLLDARPGPRRHRAVDAPHRGQRASSRGRAVAGRRRRAHPEGRGRR